MIKVKIRDWIAVVHNGKWECNNEVILDILNGISPYLLTMYAPTLDHKYAQYVVEHLHGEIIEQDRYPYSEDVVY